VFVKSLANQIYLQSLVELLLWSLPANVNLNNTILLVEG
jgi:hypothetical protein